MAYYGLWLTAKALISSNSPVRAPYTGSLPVSRLLLVRLFQQAPICCDRQRGQGGDVPPRYGPVAPRVSGALVRAGVRRWRGAQTAAIRLLSRPNFGPSIVSVAASTTYCGLLKQPDKQEPTIHPKPECHFGGSGVSSFWRGSPGAGRLPGRIRRWLPPVPRRSARALILHRNTIYNAEVEPRAQRLTRRRADKIHVKFQAARLRHNDRHALDRERNA